MVEYYKLILSNQEHPLAEIYMEINGEHSAVILSNTLGLPGIVKAKLERITEELAEHVLDAVFSEEENS